ncbi:hypothetical protein BDZ91DRAFT_751677 [Kalaharituber pfeilii]|nr:hypothetical protein BDZ91DRAFT_751677 [Kalaharituber pfeilii]
MSHCETSGVKGEPLSTGSATLEAAAGATQSFAPLTNICAHLNAFHVDANDLSRHVEVTHYCAHLNEDFRQCLLYDSDAKDARLIGIEYMISERLYKDLDPEEKKYWHSHVFEVKSGMLVMPRPAVMPQAVWERAETKAMEEVVTVYGKIYHLWQTDKGHKLPVGPPVLMSSFIALDQFDFAKWVGERDARIGEDWRRKAEIRKHIKVPEIDPDADSCWKKKMII